MGFQGQYSTESEGGKSLKCNLWGAGDGDRLCESCSSHFCDWLQFQLSVDVNNRVRADVSWWKATSSPGHFSLGTRLGGKLTCTITCVALFEAVGVCDGPKSLSTSIKGETVVRKTFLRNFATWKSCLREVLDLLRWCEEVDEDILAGWGSSSNHRHFLYSILRISGCWWRLGWHVDKTTIRHSRSAGSSFSSLQFRRKSALFQVCWTAWIVGWEFCLLSPSSVVLDRLLLMPCQSAPILVTREAKWRLNFSGTWSKLMQNNQNNRGGKTTSLFHRKTNIANPSGKGG